MREQNIGIVEVSEMTQAISHYYELGNYFTDLKRNNPFIDNFNEFLVKRKADVDYWKSELVRNWNRIDFYMVDQLWGSTSCGWGGMGGSAMTNNFNTIIENKYIGLFFVYWNGKLAYIAEINDKIDYGSLPDIDDCNKILRNGVQLNVIYKSR